LWGRGIRQLGSWYRGELGDARQTEQGLAKCNQNPPVERDGGMNFCNLIEAERDEEKREERREESREANSPKKLGTEYSFARRIGQLTDRYLSLFMLVA
jgi:hypothetical protein